MSSIALFTSNTSNYFAVSIGGTGVSSLLGLTSSGLSTIATFTSNTSNYYKSLFNLDVSTTLVSVVATYATIFGLSTTQAVSTSRAILYYLSTAINTPVNAAATVFYLNNSVPNGSYGSLQASQTTGGYQTVVTDVSGNTSNVFVRGFKTDISLPTFIPAGIWDLNLFAFDTNNAIQLYASLYKCNAALSETFIATSSNAPDLINNADITQYDLTFNVPYTNLESTDSLIIKVFANNTSVNPGSVTTYYEGFYYSHLHTTFGTIIPSQSLTSTVEGLGSAGYISTAQYNLLSNTFTRTASTVALFTSNTSNYMSNLFVYNISASMSSATLFTSNTSNYMSNLFVYNISASMSSTTLFTSNTSNYFMNTTRIDISSGLSSLQNFTGAVSNYFMVGFNYDPSTTLQSTMYSTVASLNTNTSAAFQSTLSGNSQVFRSLSANISTLTVDTIAMNAIAVSSIQTNSLIIGTGTGWVNIGPIQALATSTVQETTGTLYAMSTMLGITSSQTAVQFYGLGGTYQGTAIAETSTAPGSQELLLFKASSITDQIRLQTTGNIVFEAGASARSFPTTTQLVTPTLYIAGASSNIGIGTATPQTTLDVVGTGRFVTLSTLNFNFSSLNGFTLNQLLTSTAQGLGTFGYASTSYVTGQISSFSTVLFNALPGYFAAAKYISSLDLQSTVVGLGSYGYSGITPVQLVSTTDGLGLVYLSTGGTGNLITTQLTSTVAGLGTAQYASTSYVFLSNTGTPPTFPQFVNTQITTLVTQANLSSVANAIPSTVIGLGLTGYTSTSLVFFSNAGTTVNIKFPVIGGNSLSTTISILSTTFAGISSVFFTTITDFSLVSTTTGLGTFGYISAATLAVTSNYFKNLQQDFSTGLSSIALLTSNTSNYLLANAAGQGTSSLLGVTSTGLSTTALFTSNTSNYFKNLLQDFSTPVSTVAAYTSNVYLSVLFTSNYATAISNYYVQPFSFNISTPYSTLGAFTSNTSNYFSQNAGGPGTSSLFGVTSSALSTLALFTSNTSNVLAGAYVTSLTSSLIGLGTLGYISTVSLQSTVASLQNINMTTLGFPSTLNGLAQVGQFSTLNYVRIQPNSANIWVATGTDTTYTLKNSLDGINWGATNGSFTTSGNGIAYNGSLWVAVGQDSSTAGSIKYSYDGITFSNSLTGGFSGYGSGVAWNGFQWIAVGSDTINTIQRSSDGINWFSVTTGQFTSYGSATAWNGYTWVGVGSDATTSMKYSLNGLIWLNATSGGFTGAGRGLVWNGSIWVAVGTDTATTIKYSLDGSNWIAASNGFTSSGAAVAWNGRMFVSVGTDSTPGNTIKYSYNGQVWSNAGTGFATAGNGISWNGYLWVAVGQDSTAAGSQKYSFDGLIWTNSISGGFTGVGKGIGWSSNTTPSFSQATLDILPQGVPLFFRSTNQILAQPSSLLINNTAQIDLFYKRVGINCNAPQYTLDVFGAARVSSLFIGNLSTQNTIQFYGKTGGFTNTVIAEISSGSTTQELLLFRGSSIGDQIRLQTTGNILFEAGAPARTFPNSGQLSTPSMVITSYGSVAIGYSTPSYTLDVAGSGRFLGNVVMGAMFVGVAFL